MTVAQLIRALEAFDPDEVVYRQAAHSDRLQNTPVQSCEMDITYGIGATVVIR